MVGAMISRAEPIVLRLALLYALLDCSGTYQCPASERGDCFMELRGGMPYGSSSERDGTINARYWTCWTILE